MTDSFEHHSQTTISRREFELSRNASAHSWRKEVHLEQFEHDRAVSGEDWQLDCGLGCQ
jgi:hypothetical protein